MSKSDHPYRHLPPHCFWRSAVAEPEMGQVDPVVSSAFTVMPGHRVVTAGSCFAQHIAKHLMKSGFNYWVTEPAHPILPAHVAEEFNYGTYSARYGNLYTTRQLLQLFNRAYGLFQPAEDIWPTSDGRFIDPFRPQIQPGGFATRTEFDVDREQHFAAVRLAFENLDLLIFTLGLTECWVSREDGSVFPLCPGVSGGQFDPKRHQFMNFGVDEVVGDMLDFLSLLRAVNPNSKVLLTVSPVPLMATAEQRHVLVSTTYSKSVLRVACEQIVRQCENVAYFPSYEIITGNYNRGHYYAQDLRTVVDAGVNHVMRLFMKHYTPGGHATHAETEEEHLQAVMVAILNELEEATRVVCEEEALHWSPVQQEPVATALVGSESTDASGATPHVEVPTKKKTVAKKKTK